MDLSTLNLTRKWRSKSFDQVIGQELSVRMLKNTLYRNQFFPVYLFSGQRGCGKTSTARIFAAAVNCAALQAFQENPKSVTIPCLVCPSCLAMSAGRHPDFFEIDAASHTGVDTVRQLIDSSQLLPVMGRRKIYLIDEAHMLSKASFNALLKILEEPSPSVLFMLATTDVHKIIETVRSRCFQLFFNAVSLDHIHQHLATVCAKESIIVDDQALALISSHAQGSLRDALNLLEQVRFSSAKVTKQAVLAVIGYLDDEQVVTLFEQVFTATPARVLAYMHEIALESYCPERVWERLVACARAALWVKHGVRPQQFLAYEARIKRVVAHCSWAVLSQLCERLHAEQTVFQRTTAKYALIEMILLQASHTTSGTTNGTAGSAAQVVPVVTTASTAATQTVDGTDEEMPEVDDDEDDVKSDDLPALWARFVRDSERLGDPLLKSIFQQGTCTRFVDAQVHVEFSKQFVFFQDWLTTTESSWSPLVRAVFGPKAALQVSFTGNEIRKQIEQPGAEKIGTPVVQQPRPVQSAPVLSGHQYRSYNGPKNNMRIDKKEIVIDITKNVQAWPLAHILVRQFPGTITEIGETTHV
ncbi:DNA polymerase III subunit gamma/tau [Candidatus Dependentiae bacterium]|nr:DNA polymerase III subunit gamma/tau [Candidatus Dependentiae bacterium]